MSLKLLNWNVGWARLGTPRGDVVRDVLAQGNYDIICLTEAYNDAALFPAGGHLIESHQDYGYPIKVGRRKVLLWSKQRWDFAYQVNEPQVPGGRLVGGTTQTALGSLHVVGVCIPWPMAHVTTGGKNRQRWQDHKHYLDGLHRLLQHPHRQSRTLVVGDFNQPLPKRWQPKSILSLLHTALAPHFTIATQGTIPELNATTIDHVAHTTDLKPTMVRGWQQMNRDGDAHLSKNHPPIECQFTSAP